MNVPWESLALSRFVATDGRGALVFTSGRPSFAETVAPSEDLPLVAYGSRRATRRAIDLELLGRTFLPTHPDHSLESLCARYAVPIAEGREREAIGGLFAFLLAEGLALPADLLSLLAQLLPEGTGALVGRLVPLAQARPQARPHERPSPEDPPLVTVDEALGRDGAIARDFDTFEDRPGQRAMAAQVAEALARGGTLAVEAGPGTGKTFAYLVPAILYLRKNPALRLVVSTRTKQLQEQLFTKDLPFLVSRLHPRLPVALLKGRENYACLRRWEIVLQESIQGLDRDLLPALAVFAGWLFRSETGDIEENAAFFADPNAPSLWARLRDDPRHCTGPVCPFVQDCFSFAARRRAREASLVVVNHSLLFADLESGQEILGSYASLIADEAHALEGATRQAFTSTLAEETLKALLGELEAPSGHRPGGWLARAPLSPDDPRLQHARQISSALRSMNGRLFASLLAVLPGEARGRTPLLDGLRPQADHLAQTLSELEKAIEEVAEAIPDAESRTEAERLIAETGEVKGLLATCFEPERENAVHWYERADGEVALHVSPIEVAPILAEALYPRLEGLVLTSATLSSNDAFAYLRDALGLESAPGTFSSSTVEGLFAYDECMRVYFADFLPLVDGPEDEYAEALASLVTAAAGMERKTLVLFTSHRLLRAVHDRIGGACAVLAQGISGPKSKVIEQFRAIDGATVLLGTDSFWEGIDLPGRDLEILIITRLPFPVPTDPILAALGERAERSGKDAFLDLALPQAILRLRQGIGRLIRRRTDRGAVILTDRRILHKSYGPYFSQSLPVHGRRADTLEGLLEDLEAWFRSHRTDDSADALSRGESLREKGV